MFLFLWFVSSVVLLIKFFKLVLVKFVVICVMMLRSAFSVNGSVRRSVCTVKILC